MISVLLLGFDRTGREAVQAGDAVRTLASLVPATVDGLVRDLCLAAPDSVGLQDVADHAGCGFCSAETVRDALRLGSRHLRASLVLVLGCGAVIDGAVIDELSRLLPGVVGATGFHLVRTQRDDLLGRLFPAMAPAAAVLAPRMWLEATDAPSFPALVRVAKPARILRARIWVRR